MCLNFKKIPSAFVVWDTNAYRSFVARKNEEQIKQDTLKLLSAENAKNYQGHMCSIVAIELMSHWLDDSHERSYKSCIAGAKLMYEHCRIDANHFRALPQTEVQIAHDFYHRPATNSILTQNAIGQDLSKMYACEIGKEQDVIESIKEDLLKTCNFIANGEDGIRNVAHSFLRTYDPNYKNDYKPFINDDANRKRSLEYLRSQQFVEETSLAMLVAVAMYIDVPITANLEEYKKDENLMKQIQRYADQYMTSIKFRQLWMEKLVGGSYDMSISKHANSIWDEHVLHFVNQTIQGRPIIFVSCDGAMKEAANKTGAINKVMNLNEYLELIGCNVTLNVN